MFAVIGRGLFYKVAAKRFGTVGRAFFTLFQLITLDDWYYMYNDVVETNSGDSLFVILYIICTMMLLKRTQVVPCLLSYEVLVSMELSNYFIGIYNMLY